MTRERAALIRRVDIAAGWLAMMVGVPALTWALLFLLDWAFRRTGVAAEADGLLDRVSALLALVALSPMFSWIGMILFAPVSLALRATGAIGWAATAGVGAAIGAVCAPVMVATMSRGFGGALADAAVLAVFTAPVGALLAAAYWLTLRLVRPEAFGADDGAPGRA